MIKRMRIQFLFLNAFYFFLKPVLNFFFNFFLTKIMLFLHICKIKKLVTQVTLANPPNL